MLTTASYIMKGQIPAVNRRLPHVPLARIFVSSITEAELRYEVAKQGTKRLHQILEEFLLRVAVLPWDSDAAKEYGILRADLVRMGQPIGNLDTMVGAHALALGAILVTNDPRV